MFELDIDMLKEQGIQLFDTAKKTAQDIADKGKNQLELLNQQARLSKAQRQLGALVYSLHKAGEENQPLVDKYIDAVAEVEKSIEELRSAPPASLRKKSRSSRMSLPPGKKLPRKKSRKSPLSCAARPRSAPSARPRWTATPSSATIAAPSCKVYSFRKNNGITRRF